MIHPTPDSCAAHEPTQPTSTSAVCPSCSLSVTDHVAGLLNLPVELQRKIAFDVGANDYAHLRQSCTTLTENLYSFSILAEKLTHTKISGHLKSQYEAILHDRFKILTNDDKHIHQALTTLKLSTPAPEINCCYIEFKISTDIPDEKNKIICGNIQRLLDHIGFKYVLCMREFDLENMIYNYSFGLDMQWSQYEDGDIFPAQLLFETFKSTFDNTKNPCKYVVAAYAAKVMQRWSHIPPRNTDKTTIDNIAVSYKDLIAIGEYMICTAPKK